MDCCSCLRAFAAMRVKLPGDVLSCEIGRGKNKAWGGGDRGGVGENETGEKKGLEKRLTVI